LAHPVSATSALQNHILSLTRWWWICTGCAIVRVAVAWCVHVKSYYGVFAWRYVDASVTTAIHIDTVAFDNNI